MNISQAITHSMQEKRRGENKPKEKKREEENPVQKGFESRQAEQTFHIATQPFSAAFKNSCSQTVTQPSSSLP